MLRILRAFLHKEIREALRDRRMAMIIVLAPIIQIVIFGYVVSTELRNIRFAVVGQVQTTQQRQWLQDLAASGTFEFQGWIAPQDLWRAFRRQRVTMAIAFPSPELQTRQPFQVILDGTDANRIRFAIQYLQEFWRQKLRTPAPLQLRVRVLFNPGLESRVYMVPGVLVMIIILMTTVLTAVAVVREKEVGTLEQIQVTPLTPFQFILGKTTPFTLIAWMDALLVLAVARLLFHMPMRALWLVPFVAISLYILGNVGIALIVSTISETQTQAMMTGFFLILPMLLLSGLFFPIASMPPVFQKAAWLNPLTHFLLIIRSAFIKGAGFLDLAPSFLYLTVFAVLSFGVAMQAFRRAQFR